MKRVRNNKSKRISKRKNPSDHSSSKQRATSIGRTKKLMPPPATVTPDASLPSIHSQIDQEKKETHTASVTAPNPKIPPTSISLQPITGLDLFTLPLSSIISFTWSWGWRSLVYSLILMVILLIGGFFIGLLMGLLMVLIHYPEPAVKLFIQLAVYFIAITLSILGLPFFLRWMTTHQLGKFRLSLSKEEDGKDLPTSQSGRS